MPEKNESTAVGVFEDYNTAQTVARELVDSGIPREAIQVNSNFATGAAGSGQRYDMEQEEHGGGVSGFFHRLFGSHDSDNEHGHYAEAVRRGNSVVTVTASADVLDRAVQIMNQHDPIDIDRRVASYKEGGYQRYDPNAPAYTSEEAARERERLRGESSTRTIPVVEEELQIGKRVVQRGGVRVYSHVVERPVEENIVLREEHVRVERRPVDRVLNASDTAALRDQSIEVTETAEEAVVSKRTRVKEEVVVGKESTERKQQIRDTVRRTDVNVEKMEPRTGGGTADYRDDFRRDYETNYARSGVPYTSLEPAYEYGYSSAADARYRGKTWTDAESDLKTDYLRRNPNSTWDQIKGAVRYGWEKVTGKR
jgi:uncharacterized protein (TIGR02271 family)